VRRNIYDKGLVMEKTKAVPQTDCDKECKFLFGSEFKTMVYYQPMYDKQGNLISKDGNTISGACNCIVCNKHWTYICAHDNTNFTEWSK